MYVLACFSFGPILGVAVVFGISRLELLVLASFFFTNSIPLVGNGVLQSRQFERIMDLFGCVMTSLLSWVDEPGPIDSNLWMIRMRKNEFHGEQERSEGTDVCQFRGRSNPMNDLDPLSFYD